MHPISSFHQYLYDMLDFALPLCSVCGARHLWSGDAGRLWGQTGTRGSIWPKEAAHLQPDVWRIFRGHQCSGHVHDVHVRLPAKRRHAGRHEGRPRRGHVGKSKHGDEWNGGRVRTADYGFRGLGIRQEAPSSLH